MARSRGSFSGNIAGENTIMTPFPVSQWRFSGGDSRSRRWKEQSPQFSVRNAAISGDRGHKRGRSVRRHRRRDSEGVLRVLTRRELGSRLSRSSGLSRVLDSIRFDRIRVKILGSRIGLRMRGPAAEPGVTGPVQDRDYLLEPGDGEISGFSEIEVT